MAIKSPKTAENMGGTCYEDAARALLFDPQFKGWKLIHGRPTLTCEPFAEYGHAWLESGFAVYNAASDHRCHTLLFYAVGQIDPDNDLFSYDEEMARLMLHEHGHFGPWEGVDALPEDLLRTTGVWEIGTGKRIRDER